MGLSAPLIRKLRKANFNTFGPLNELESTAVALLKEALISLPALALSRTEEKDTLDTVACDQQVRSVVPQEREDRSMTLLATGLVHLNEKEQKLTTTHKECLAALFAVPLLCLYLEGFRFTNQSDHEAHQWILTMTAVTGRPA